MGWLVLLGVVLINWGVFSVFNASGETSSGRLAISVLLVVAGGFVEYFAWSRIVAKNREQAAGPTGSARDLDTDDEPEEERAVPSMITSRPNPVISKGDSPSTEGTGWQQVEDPRAAHAPADSRYNEILPNAITALAVSAVPGDIAITVVDVSGFKINSLIGLWNKHEAKSSTDRSTRAFRWIAAIDADNRIITFATQGHLEDEHGPLKRGFLASDTLVGNPKLLYPSEETEGRESSASSASDTTVGDVLTELERLGRLRDARVLTEAEFEQQKRRILGPG